MHFTVLLWTGGLRAPREQPIHPDSGLRRPNLLNRGTGERDATETCGCPRHPFDHGVEQRHPCGQSDRFPGFSPMGSRGRCSSKCQRWLCALASSSNS